MNEYSVKLKATNFRDIDLKVIASSAFDAIQEAKAVAIKQDPGFDAQVVYYISVDRNDS